MTRGVAIVTRFYPPYPAGAEVNAARLARLIASARGSCEVVTTRYLSTLPKVEADQGVTVRRLPVWRGVMARPIEFVSAFAHFLSRGGRFGVVHTMCISAFALGAILGARIRGVATIITPCTIGPSGDICKLLGRPGGRLLWRLFLGADVALASNEISADHFRDHGIPETRLAIIPGIAAAGVGGRLSPAARVAKRRELMLPDRPTVLYVGRLEPAKGVDLLLDAWPEVVRLANAVLVLVGDGTLRERALREASMLDDSDALQVVGLQSDPSRYYEAADIFVFPSRGETFGLALADAMAHGLAVVATPTGLAPTWIRDQQDGVIIPDGDRSAIASALRGLLLDEGRRGDLGDNARQRARAFHPERVGRTYLALYERLESGEPPQPDPSQPSEV